MIDVSHKSLLGQCLFGHLHFTISRALWLILFLLYTNICEEPLKPYFIKMDFKNLPFGTVSGQQCFQIFGRRIRLFKMSVNYVLPFHKRILSI